MNFKIKEIVNMKVYLYETCLPRSWMARDEKGQIFHKKDDENLNQFRWRIVVV